MPSVNPGPASSSSVNSTAVLDTAVNVSTDALLLSLISGSVASAAYNTATLQQALNSGGLIKLITPGVFYLNAPLIYGSNTQLSLGQNTTLMQAPGTNQMMLQSASAAAYVAGQTTNVTLTWASGVQCSVAWPNHGLTAGQAVWLSGSTPTVFNGIFRVFSVTDTNDFVINLRYVPASAPSGSAVGIVATQNFLLEGGLWDYNFSNNSVGTGRNRSALWFEGVADVLIRNVRAQNAYKYAFGCAAALNLRAYDLIIPFNNSDGMKLYGPIFDCQIQGIKGQTGDDGISVQGKEAAAFSSYQIAAGGDAIGITIRDVDLAPTSSAVMVAGVYTSDNEITDQILIENVQGGSPGTGVNAAAVRLMAGNGYTTGQFGKITLRNISAANAQQQITTGSNVITGDILVIEDCHLNLTSLTSGNFFQSQNNTTVNKILIAKCDIYQSTWPTATTNPIVFGGIHDLCSVKSINHRSGGSANSRFVLVNNANVKMVALEDVRSSGSDTIIQVAANVTNTPFLKLLNCDFEAACAISLSNSCNVHTSGCRWTNASNAVVRFNATATVNHYSDGTNILVAGSWLATPAGTPTYNPKGWDIQVDVGATGVTKTLGNYCFNIGASRGTLVQNRYVTCDGTSWYQLNVPGNTF